MKPGAPLLQCARLLDQMLKLVLRSYYIASTPRKLGRIGSAFCPLALFGGTNCLKNGCYGL